VSNVRGWVYVITNKAMPGLVKVGFSTKDPLLRANELAHTGSPHPYMVAYDALIRSPRDVEQALHSKLSQMREGKEWFRCSVAVVVAEIRSLYGPEILLEQSGSTNDDDEDEAPAILSDTVRGPCTYCGTLLEISRDSYAEAITCPGCKRKNYTTDFIRRWGWR
jgi:hypothetical protein